MRGKHSKQPASLWEVMNKNRLRQSQEKVIGKVVSQSKERGVAAEPAKPVSVARPVPKRRGPKFEFALNRRWIVICGLILLFLVLLSFRIGQKTTDSDGDMGIEGAYDADLREVERQVFPPLQNVEPEKARPDVRQTEVASDTVKDHVIVIASYNVARDLKAVGSFFAQNGIETEIRKPEDSMFYQLVTKQRYESPLKKGTDGYFALEKIKKVGADYKAPKGYEPFGSKPFQDAYGMKIGK